MTFLWNDPNVFPVVDGHAYPNKVSYFYDSSSKKLLRRICKNDGAANTSTAAVSLGSQPTVQCFNSGAPATPVAVQRRDHRPLGEDGGDRGARTCRRPTHPAPAPYTFTLLGTRRAE